MENLKTAIIDIGSNTVRLVMYQYDPLEGLREFGNIKTVARLRTHILPSGEMSEDGIEQLRKTLQSFKKILQDYKVDDIKAAATAAVRQATNNEEIIKRMEKETGIKIDIISEEEEAYYGFVAVAHSIDTPSAVTVDIGGGSTEITLFLNKKLQKTFSFPFGTVSLKQNFVKGTIINEEERKQLRAFVKEQFMTLPWIQNVRLPIIAIGGSARNVVQIHQQKMDYPISGVHQYEMTRNDLDMLKNMLGPMTFEDLKQLDGLSSDRADIILPAMEVFTTLMDVVQAKTFQLSKKGLREGLIYSRILQDDSDAFDKYNVFEENSRRLCYEYGRSELEVATLEHLAKYFYKECGRLELIEYNENYFKLFTRAAKLYGIGEYIELESSSQHTFYLIANQSIAGMNHRERVKLALLASYKNKDFFRRFTLPFSSWIDREEMKRLKDYGAMLKFIYALNVSKRHVVKRIDLELVDEQVNIYLMTKESAVAEIYEAEHQKKHIERVFKRNVKLIFMEEGRK